MTRATRAARGIAGAVLGLGILAGCASGDTLRTETGLVIAIDSQGLGRVEGFTLRLRDGRELRFDTTTTRFDARAFPPDHLHEHRMLAEPVRVTYRDRDGVRQVVRLDDAPE